MAPHLRGWVLASFIQPYRLMNNCILFPGLRRSALGMTSSLILLSGCASMESALERSTPREDVVDSINDSAAQVAEVNGRIDDAVRQLDDLLNHPAARLEPQFDGYVDALERLKGAAESLNEHTDALQRKGREYLISWDREIATVRESELRESASERRQEVARRFDVLQERYAEARDQLAPLLRHLEERKAAISVDLTAAGIAQLQDSFEGARSAVSPARNALNDLGNALREAANAMVARGTAPVAPANP
jgi:chromosome segregation ATPase